jgi:hypothetical protein
MNLIKKIIFNLLKDDIQELLDQQKIDLIETIQKNHQQSIEYIEDYINQLDDKFEDKTNDLIRFVNDNTPTARQVALELSDINN